MSQNKSNPVAPVGQLRPRSQFDVAFILHVLPRMRAAVVMGGHFVKHDLEPFFDAVSRVREIGRKRGSSRLSPRTYDELLDWIDCRLLEAVEGPDAPGLITPARLAEITGEPRQTAGGAVR